MSGLPDIDRTSRIHTLMGVDVLVHRLPGVPGAVVLDFLSHQQRPEVLVPVTGGPSIEDPRIKPPTAPMSGEDFAILLAQAFRSAKSPKCPARNGHRPPRVKAQPKRKKRRGRRHAQTHDWLD